MTSATPPPRVPTAAEIGVATMMLILTPMFWAGHSVVARLVAGEIPTFSLVSFRWLVALAIFLVFVHRRVWAERWMLIRHWRFVVVIGLVGPAAFPVLLYTGLETTTVTNTSIIQTLVPGMVPLIAWVMLRERVAWAQIIGILISGMGVVLIVTKGNPLALTEVTFVPGDFFILGAFMLWAIYTVAVRLKPADMHANTLLAASMAVGGLATLPLWGVEAARGDMIPTTKEAAAAIGYIVMFPTLLAYYFYNHAIAVVGPTKAGLASHLVPPLGIVLGVVFLNETFATYHAVSFAAILSGVVIVIRSGRASSSRAPV